MGLLAALRELFGGTPKPAKDAGESQYPPENIDYSAFNPPGPSDVRSPCPMLNALCNHSILPHDGRNITKAMAVNALIKAINLDGGVASLFASQAVRLNPDVTAHSFDLDHLSKHGVIEHDVSLAHNDIAFGDNHSFNGDIWGKVLEVYGDAEETSFELASKARYSRVKASKQAHDEAGAEFTYGIKELILSYGESALFLGILGDPENGKIPIKYLKVLFEHDRLPYSEGWRKSPRPITQGDMNHMMMNLVLANEDKVAEAELVALGTVEAVNNTIKSMMPTMCAVM